MSGIKIPVSAELNQQDIGQQIKQVEGALNDLGRVPDCLRSLPTTIA